MRELTFFLGLQVKQKNDEIFISQDKYAAEILKKFWFTEVKNASTPMETQKPLLKDKDGKEVDVHMYRSMIGSLMYLTSTRPDIMSVVCACARYQVNPKVSHLHVVKNIFRYLKGRPKLGLWYPKDSLFDLVAYTDSDYARASLDRKSTIGVLLVILTTAEFLLLVLLNIVRVDGKKVVISEASIRRDLQFVDGEGVDCLPNSTIIEQLASIGIGKGFSKRTTPLFLKMVVQSQLDEGSAMPTDPHHTPTILQSSSSQPQKTHKPRKPTRKVTEVPQPSDPIEHVADEAVHRELGDSLVRAAITASSLEAKQDNVGGPKCQKAMEDTIAQTRFKNVSKQSNDSLVARGNTLQSDEDRLKLNELMEFRTNLQTRVLDLEKTKTTQANVIDSLKRRVKKLEKRIRSRNHKLKRLYKISLTARVESSDNEEILGGEEDKGKGILVEELVKPKKKDQIRLDEKAGLKLQAEFDEEQRLSREKDKKELEANITLIETWDDVQAKINTDHQLAERLQAEEQQKLTDEEKATLFMQFLNKRREFFAAKREEEKMNKPLTQS
nr:hypothetical protein [Tanacetum cinerariifolium]GEY19404.1 hypothetical protein [Tanacetum cinerariifolium]